MAYTLYFDRWGEIDEAYGNLTWDYVQGDNDILSQSDSFDYFFDSFDDKDSDYEELNFVDYPEPEKERIMDAFRESESFWDLQDGYIPMYNIIHMLQSEPTEEMIEMVERYARVCSIVDIYTVDTDPDVSTSFLALTGCGMDFSDNLELAYYICDGVSPISTRQVMSLGSKATRLLEYCQSVVKKDGRVSFYEIKKFLETDEKPRDILEKTKMSRMSVDVTKATNYEKDRLLNVISEMGMTIWTDEDGDAYDTGDGKFNFLIYDAPLEWTLSSLPGEYLVEMSELIDNLEELQRSLNDRKD
jgi:hypothetical protein